jgi:hypothetical protein
MAGTARGLHPEDELLARVAVMRKNPGIFHKQGVAVRFGMVRHGGDYSRKPDR